MNGKSYAGIVWDIFAACVLVVLLYLAWTDAQQDIDDQRQRVDWTIRQVMTLQVEVKRLKQQVKSLEHRLYGGYDELQ